MSDGLQVISWFRLSLSVRTVTFLLLSVGTNLLVQAVISML